MHVYMICFAKFMHMMYVETYILDASACDMFCDFYEYAFDCFVKFVHVCVGFQSVVGVIFLRTSSDWGYQSTNPFDRRSPIQSQTSYFPRGRRGTAPDILCIFTHIYIYI